MWGQGAGSNELIMKDGLRPTVHGVSRKTVVGCELRVAETGMSLIVENFRMLEGEICDHQR